MRFDRQKHDLGLRGHGAVVRGRRCVDLCAEPVEPLADRVVRGDRAGQPGGANAARQAERHGAGADKAKAGS